MTPNYSIHKEFPGIIASFQGTLHPSDITDLVRDISDDLYKHNYLWAVVDYSGIEDCIGFDKEFMRQLYGQEVYHSTVWSLTHVAHVFPRIEKGIQMMDYFRHLTNSRAPKWTVNYFTDPKKAKEWASETSSMQMPLGHAMGQ